MRAPFRMEHQLLAPLGQVRHGTAPEARAGAQTYHDLVEGVLAGGNATLELPSMLLLLYQLSMCAPLSQRVVPPSGNL